MILLSLHYYTTQINRYCNHIIMSITYKRITRILILESLSWPVSAPFNQPWQTGRAYAPVSYSRHSFLLFKPQPERITNALLILASSWSIVSNILPRLLKRILLRNRGLRSRRTKTKSAMITEASAEHNAIDELTEREIRVNLLALWWNVKNV